MPLFWVFVLWSNTQLCAFVTAVTLFPCYSFIHPLPAHRTRWLADMAMYCGRSYLTERPSRCRLLLKSHLLLRPPGGNRWRYIMPPDHSYVSIALCSFKGSVYIRLRIASALHFVYSCAKYHATRSCFETALYFTYAETVNTNRTYCIQRKIEIHSQFKGCSINATPTIFISLVVDWVNVRAYVL